MSKYLMVVCDGCGKRVKASPVVWSVNPPYRYCATCRRNFKRNQKEGRS